MGFWKKLLKIGEKVAPIAAGTAAQNIPGVAAGLKIADAIIDRVQTGIHQAEEITPENVLKAAFDLLRENGYTAKIDWIFFLANFIKKDQSGDAGRN
jgi:hypothetical protein